MSAVIERTVTAVKPLRQARNDRMLVAGLAERFTDEEFPHAVAALWRRFAVQMIGVSGQTGIGAYGVRYATELPGEMEYLCAVEVTDFCSVPRSFTLMCIPVQHCAVFRSESVATLTQTWSGIRDSWLPSSPYESVGTQFDYYGPQFDPRTCSGNVEVWIPVAPSTRYLRTDSLRRRLSSEQGWTSSWRQ